MYVCRRISGLETDEDSFNGTCEWVDPEDARPGELTDGMAISCDCVRLGPGWWQDTYFGWYFVLRSGARGPVAGRGSLLGEGVPRVGAARSMTARRRPGGFVVRRQAEGRSPEQREFMRRFRRIALLGSLLSFAVLLLWLLAWVTKRNR